MDNIGRQMFFVVNVVAAVVQVLQIWQGIFYLQVFHCLHSLIFFVLQQVLMIWGGVFHAQAFFTLHSFPTFFIQLDLLDFLRELVVLPQRILGFMLKFET